MRAGSTLTIFVVLSLAAATAVAQNGDSTMKNRLTDLVEARLRTQQQVTLSADSITLTGDALRLVGHARVRFGDAWINADELVIDQSTKRVQLVGNVRADLRSSAAGVLGTRPPPPRIEYK
jgi:lipopolysaccharide assembly outer membrane protein LptD (OstA)